MKPTEKKRIDWMLTLVPFILIMGLAVLMFIFPDGSNRVISKVRFFFGDTVGIYYLIIGVGILIVSLFLDRLLGTASADSRPYSSMKRVWHVPNLRVAAVHRTTDPFLTEASFP